MGSWLNLPQWAGKMPIVHTLCKSVLWTRPREAAKITGWWGFRDRENATDATISDYFTVSSHIRGH